MTTRQFRSPLDRRRFLIASAVSSVGVSFVSAESAVDLSRVVVDDFIEFKGREFAVWSNEGRRVTLRLAEVQLHSRNPMTSRTPFTLYFQGGAKLSDGIHSVFHDEVGLFRVFVSQTQPNEYQVAFN